MSQVSVCGLCLHQMRDVSHCGPRRLRARPQGSLGLRLGRGDRRGRDTGLPSPRPHSAVGFTLGLGAQAQSHTSLA